MVPLSPERLTPDARNRALFLRQSLTAPVTTDPLALVRHLGAVQAQERFGAHVALWARQRSFSAQQLDGLRQRREVVRATLQRGTIHLLTSEDYREWQSLYRSRTEELLARRGHHLAEDWREQVRDALGDEAYSGPELRPLLKQVLGLSEQDLSLQFLHHQGLGLVRAPGPNGESLGGKERWQTYESLTGEDLRLDAPAAARSMVLRYLGAFGPATAPDFSRWSGLRSQRKLMDSLWEEGVLSRGELMGKHYYDLATEPTDPADPPHLLLLADFDNLLIGHADRSHLVSKNFNVRLGKNLRVMAPMVLDGAVVGVWALRITASAQSAALEPFQSLSPATRRGFEELAEGALAMLGYPNAAVSWVAA